MSDEKDIIRNFLVDLTSRIQEDTRVFREMIVDIQRQFEEPLRSFFKEQKRFEETLKPWIETKKQIDEAMEPMRQMQEKLAKDFSSIVAQVHEFQGNLNSWIVPAFKEIAESWRKLPERTQNALIILGAHGWYLDLEMPLPGLWELEKALVNGDADDAEQALVEYFRERTPEIERSLIKNFPHRAKILRSAFLAHSRGEYDLSVPVFLAQTDGICQELIGTELFRKRKGVPFTAAYIETLTMDSYRMALLHPLSVTLPISASKHERDDKFVGLNRHQVLHGESTEYGTELNSLKAISLLNYLAQVLSDRKDGSH